MFGYLLLLFQMFLGGHFHMASNGHPSNRNIGELFHARKDLMGTKEGSEMVPLPEWEWQFGKLVFQGDLARFFQMPEHKKTHEYIRSGATMWKEGICSLVILMIESVMSVFLVKTILSQEQGFDTVCPQYNDLCIYCEVETLYSIFALMVCWVSTVRGVTANRKLWTFFVFLGLLDIGWVVDFLLFFFQRHDQKFVSMSWLLLLHLLLLLLQRSESMLCLFFSCCILQLEETKKEWKNERKNEGTNLTEGTILHNNENKQKLTPPPHTHHHAPSLSSLSLFFPFPSPVP